MPIRKSVTGIALASCLLASSLTHAQGMTGPWEQPLRGMAKQIVDDLHAAVKVIRKGDQAGFKRHTMHPESPMHGLVFAPMRRALAFVPKTDKKTALVAFTHPDSPSTSIRDARVVLGPFRPKEKSEVRYEVGGQSLVFLLRRARTTSSFLRSQTNERIRRRRFQIPPSTAFKVPCRLCPSTSAWKTSLDCIGTRRLSSTCTASRPMARR